MDLNHYYGFEDRATGPPAYKCGWPLKAGHDPQLTASKGNGDRLQLYLNEQRNRLSPRASGNECTPRDTQ